MSDSPIIGKSTIHLENLWNGSERSTPLTRDEVLGSFENIISVKLQKMRIRMKSLIRWKIQHSVLVYQTQRIIRNMIVRDENVIVIVNRDKPSIKHPVNRAG